MPRIDPLSLLKCLSVLLGPTGGIKSKEEVHRLANLMTKFSKKLVSKCIYIQILKTTNTDLLSQFMTAGGWNLIHTWLTDGILAKNWALIQELLELLLLCPVDIERLKSNNCPKLIKGLSKEGSHQGVRTLASRLVEQWLKIVKGEAAPNSVPAQIMTVPVQSNAIAGQTVIIPSSQQLQHSTSTHQTVDAENATVHVQDFKFTQSTSSISLNQQDQEKQQQLQERLQPQTVQVVGKVQQAQVQQQVTQQCKKQSFVVVSTSSSLPVYKITIRDGNQVLAKVETDAANISNVLNTASTSTDSGHAPNATQEAKPETEELDETEENGGAASGRDDVDVVQSDDSGHVPSEVKQTVVSSKDNQDNEGVKSKDIKDAKDIASSDSGKSSDKENRDSHKKDDKKSNTSSEKKSSGHHHGSSSMSSSSSKSSKHGTSSSTHRSSSTSHRSSSHRSGSSSSSSSKNSSNSSKDRSSKDKDKHHSSSSSKHSSSRSKSDRDKEREKEKQKKDQAEKDKATLEKVQGQALSSKMGKIPKKRTEDEKSSDANGRKSSIESRDSSKENKEKADSKKDAIATKPVAEKKNISISIENRKNSQDSGARPKTVKTFNSKFRSTGLEEEVKPPPPRSKKAAPATDKKVLPPKLPLKRPSPLRDVPLVEKRMKLSLDSPTTPPSDEKKGGIKLIPPKPKPMMLQESDMFMDALTASTKSKEPRKRKRRASITKDGSLEAKKQEVANTDNRESTPPPASPSNVEEKSPVALKPNFKFYQDTLEIEEDKDQREKESNEEESKKDKDQTLDEEKDNRDDDDIGSNTPTPEDDVEDIKDVESPEDTSSIVSDSTKKDSSYPEIRYVDGLKSVLLLQKRKGPKKVLKWKTDLESIRYFELDETERVNVTKTFTDMKQMEKQNEREAFQMARKLNNEDLMEERTRWKPLIPIDLPPPLVEPGKDSKEKDIQYAREKGILQALYFNRSMIPDSAAEPDEERHHVMIDPKIIPLEDLTGNKESEKDFTAVPWPEPKPQPPQPSTVTTFHYPTTYPHNQQNMMTTMGPQSTMGPMPQMPQQMMAPTHMAPMSQEMAGPMPATGGGGWRTGDGKVLVPDVGMNPMANMSGGFNQGMEGGPMVPPGMIGPPPMYNQEGYGMMCPDDMGYNNFQGPPGPMYGPGPNFPGPRGAHMHNRGRGGPGWGYRGPVRGGWRGVGGGWRGSGKQPPVCRQFSKNGYCRVGDKCQYLHPGVNCPPF